MSERSDLPGKRYSLNKVCIFLWRHLYSLSVTDRVWHGSWPEWCWKGIEAQHGFAQRGNLRAQLSYGASLWQRYKFTGLFAQTAEWSRSEADFLVDIAINFFSQSDFQYLQHHWMIFSLSINATFSILVSSPKQLGFVAQLHTDIVL